MQTLGYSTIHIFYTPESTVGQQPVATLSVDHDFFSTYRIPLIAGRAYSQDLDTPTALLRPARPDGQVERSASNIVINASAVRMLGYTSPEAAVGQQIVADSPDTAKIVTFTIAGVVADTQFFSLRQAPRAEAYILMPGFTTALSVSYQGSAEAMRQQLEQVWKQVVGDAELSLIQVEDSMAREFSREQMEAVMLVTFTVLAIIIASLGLFGSAAFTVETRTKEIGVRKVIGAEVKEIITLLLWQFSRPVLLANIIAWPVAIWAMLSWLQRFPYQLSMEQIAVLAAISSVCAMLIAALTVANSTWRVARSNPVHALRYE
jgi:putative ABC transport system permease protein